MMPKENLNINTFAVMSPSSNGGSIPVYCENLRADLGKNIMVPENTDIVEGGVDVVNSIDFWLEGKLRRIQISSNGSISVNNTPVGHVDVDSSMTPVGDMVSVNGEKPYIITFDKKINKSPIEQRAEVSCDYDSLIVPDDIHAVSKANIICGGTHALLSTIGSPYLHAVNLTTPNHIYKSGKIAGGGIVDFTIDGDIIRLLFTDANGSYIVQDRELASIGIGATFDEADFASASIINAGVFVDTGFIPTGARLSSIACTSNKVFLGACPIGSSNYPLEITYSGDRYNFDMTEDQDLMFSLSSDTVKDVSMSNPRLAFSVCSDTPSEYDVPLYKSRVPLMPYHLERYSVTKGSQDNHIGNADHVPVPYSFNHLGALSSAVAGMYDKWEWRPFGAREISEYNPNWHCFVTAIPGGCGLAPKDERSDLGYIITGKLVVLDYEHDICGMLVSSKTDMIVTKVHEYGSRLRWGPVGNEQYDDNLWDGLLGSGVGSFVWQQFIDEPLLGTTAKNTAIKIATKNPRTGDTPAANGRNFILFWNGNQTQYGGIEYTLDLIDQINKETFEETIVNPFGFNTGERFGWYSDRYREGTGWGFPYKDYLFISKKHFDSDIPEYDTGCQRGAVAISSADIALLDTQHTIRCSVVSHDDGNIVSAENLPILHIANDIATDDPPVYGGTITPTIEKETGVAKVRAGLNAADIIGDDAVISYANSDFNKYDAAITTDIALTNELEVGVFDSVIKAETDEIENPNSSLSGVSIRYRYNLVYDGFQEGPLSSFFATADPLPIVGPDTEFPPFRVKITVSIPESMFLLYGNRVTAMNVYAAKTAGDEEIELYRLLSTKPFDRSEFGVDEVTGNLSAIVWDYGDRGASFENNAGYSEDIKSPSLDRRCQAMCAGSLFVGGISPHASEDKKYTGNIVSKSLPLSPSVFDYSNEYAVLPFSPNVMRELNGRLYVFGNDQYAVINPDNMAVEHVSKTIGCVSEKHAVSNDYGLFVLYNNRVYMVSMAETTDISIPIYSNELGLPSLSTCLPNKAIFFIKKRKMLGVICGDQTNLYIFGYSQSNEGWLCYTTGEEGDSLFNVWEEDSSTIVNQLGFSYRLFEGDEKRACKVKYIIDFGDPNNKTIIYTLTANSASGTVKPKITLNGLEGQYSANENYVSFGKEVAIDRLDLTVEDTNLVGAIDGLRIIYRNLVKK